MESMNDLVSYPVDPVAPSFLELPAEMRNMIYELLFKREGLVLLHNIDAVFPKEIDWQNFNKPCPGKVSDYECSDCLEGNGVQNCRYYDDLSIYTDAKREDAEDFEAMKEDFSYGFSDGLNLLRCCQHIHHEAAGVLYGLNTFAFTRTTSRHDIAFYYDEGMAGEPEEVYDHAYDQIIYAAHWLNLTGTHYSFLRKVIIDLDAMCPSECDDSAYSREVLPLVRFMWDHPEAKCQIIFGHTGRTFPRSLHESLYKRYAAGQDVVTTRPADENYGSIDLTLVLDALGNRDSLDLRRFSRFLGSIDVRVRYGRSYFHVKYKHRLDHMRAKK